MGIAKYLKMGRIRINPNDKCIELVDCNSVLLYEQISNSEWGYIYEKYVGQILEDEGWIVDYNGLNLGFKDNGIDLIATKCDTINFIQCKFQQGIISKNQIEWILYKASKKLYDAYASKSNKLIFTLIINDKDANFSKRKPKTFSLVFTEISKVQYPILQYFLDHNYIQDKVKLECREIRMQK